MLYPTLRPMNAILLLDLEPMRCIWIRRLRCNSGDWVWAVFAGTRMWCTVVHPGGLVIAGIPKGTVSIKRTPPDTPQNPGAIQYFTHFYFGGPHINNWIASSNEFKSGTFHSFGLLFITKIEPFPISPRYPASVRSRITRSEQFASHKATSDNWPNLSALLWLTSTLTVE